MDCKTERLFWMIWVSQCNHKGLYQRKREAEERPQGQGEGRTCLRSAIAGFEEGRRGHEPGLGQPLEAGRGEET